MLGKIICKILDSPSPCLCKYCSQFCTLLCPFGQGAPKFWHVRFKFGLHVPVKLYPDPLWFAGVLHAKAILSKYIIMLSCICMTAYNHGNSAVILKTECLRIHFQSRQLVLLHFAWGVAEAKCIVYSGHGRLCVCLSRRIPTLLHGSGYNLRNVRVPSSCALLTGVAIGARVPLLWQHTRTRNVSDCLYSLY